MSAPETTVPTAAETSKPPSPPPSIAKTNAYQSDSDSDGQARGGRRGGGNTNTNNAQKQQFVVPLPTSTGLSQPAGQLLKGATDENGKPKAAALLVGIKLDLEAEVHLTARIKGDICIGLY